MKKDNRRTATFMKTKSLKVYKVTFAEFTTKGEEYLNVDQRIVLADKAYSAMNEAFERLSDSEKKTYYPQEVELIVEID